MELEASILKTMKRSARIKCPCCGMMVSQNRLFYHDYLPLVTAMFEVGNRHKGKRGGFVWRRTNEVERPILLALRDKLQRLLRKLDLVLYGYEKTEPSALAMTALRSNLMQTGSSTWRLDRPSAVRRQEESSLIISTRLLEKV